MPPEAAPAAQPTQTFRVVEYHRVPSPNPQRIGKWDRMVWYETTPGQRYIVLVPDESFTEAALRAAVGADLKERGLWLNKTFQL
jgi:predicted Abi (CAAX) family protease